MNKTSGFSTIFLTSSSVKFSKGPGNILQLMTADKVFFSRVRVFLSYPLNAPSGLISVRNADDEDLPEIGLIKNIDEFPVETQGLIKEKLEERYFRPVITNVLSLREEGDRLYWEVETDRGKRDFVVHDPYEHIRLVKDGKLLITDIHDCRYEIKKYEVLSKKVKDILSRHFYF